MVARSDQAFGVAGATAPLNILLVHREEPAALPLLRELNQRRAGLVAWERDLRQARAALDAMSFDVVVTDALLPDGQGLSLVADRSGRLPRWATILLIGMADPRLAREARRCGALGVVEKTASPERLMAEIDNAWVAHRRLPAGRKPPLPRGHMALRPTPDTAFTDTGDLLGESPAMRGLRQRLLRVSPLPVDLLVIGETGSGKDLVARQAHALSRRQGPFVAVNCGAIPETLFESELFGYEAGAFTSAGRSHAGLIEQSHGGTLLLDEIESMPLSQQVKLLRVLETRSVTRVGGRGEKPLDLRIVAAAQQSLAHRCRQGLFRPDLWYRLNVVTLEVPPLRARGPDIALLFAHHLAQACRMFGLDPARVPPMDSALLAAYDWPGNVRELRHAAERYALGMPPGYGSIGRGGQPGTLADELALCERRLIQAALERHGRRLRAAAEELGISEKTLSRRISEHGIGIPDSERGSVQGSDAKAGAHLSGQGHAGRA
jgi:two-component system, NtrC family, C4-dicarboxylate transport response regulator DctD